MCLGFFPNRYWLHRAAYVTALFNTYPGLVSGSLDFYKGIKKKVPMTHYIFDADFATTYGLDQAVMVHNLQFWIRKNKANDKHAHDGRTWTYNTLEAFIKLFPFWTQKQIRRILNSLVDDGVILKGNYSKNKSDRTNWYAFVDEAEFIQEIQHMPKQANAVAQTGKTICPNGQVIIKIHI